MSRKEFFALPKEATEHLHQLAREGHILLGDFSDFEERMEFLLKTSNVLKNLQKEHATPTTPTSKLDIETQDEMMLEFLLSKCRHSKRWIRNYRDHTNIRINLAFHLSSQVDNQLNVEISKATTAIARDTQRDSSSMITIAAVTMYFLPGTFTSALFSMVFFNFQEDANGQEQFQVSKRWWYYVVTTVPLTGLVFVVWIAWQRVRFRKREGKGQDLLGSDNEIELR